MFGWRNQESNLASEFVEPTHQASDGVVTVAPIEVLRTEIAVRHAVAEHEVGGGEHRSGNGEDRLLCAAPAASKHRSPPWRHACSRGNSATRTVPAALASSWQKTAGLAMRRRRDATHTGHDRVLVNVQPRAARIEHVHGFSSFAVRRREEPSLSKSTRCEWFSIGSRPVTIVRWPFC